MGRTDEKKHNDNDIVLFKRKDNDNDIVMDKVSHTKASVLGEISKYKLGIIQNFMFGGPCRHFGSCNEFVNPAIKQVERFTYIWMNELSDGARKLIVDYLLNDSLEDMPRSYNDYLNSPVWKYVSSVIKIAGGYTCEKCEKKFNPAHLVVHHISYAHLGSELNHLDEVSLLCNDCHMREHNVRGENARK